MKKTFFYFIILIALVSNLTFAYDCNKVSSNNHDSCISISNSLLNQSEKDLLISNLDYSSTSFPEHNFVYEKNKNIIVSDAPNGVTKKSGVYVKDAWVNILTIMPSVLYNNSLYVNQTSNVFSGFGYGVIIPSNYQSRGYPSTSGGDCKTLYSLVENNPVNNIFVNDKLQGNGNKVKVNVNSDSNIKSEFTINVGVGVSHYKWKKSCNKCSYGCSYSSYETRRESFLVKDNISVKYQNSNLFADTKVIDNYNLNTLFKVNYSDSIFLNLSDSSFSHNKFVYDIFYSKEPYYFYTLRAKDDNSEKINNLLRKDEFFLVKNTSKCEIIAYDFFNVVKKNCNLDFNNLNMTIVTDKTKYVENEIIFVKVYPSNISVNIRYGNISKIISGNTSFIADKSFNLISADYHGVKNESLIYVNKTGQFVLLLNLSVFSGLNYFFFFSLKKYWGGFI